MPDREPPARKLTDLESGERSIILSFLSLSERTPFDDSAPIDDLTLSLAVKASLKSSAN